MSVFRLLWAVAVLALAIVVVAPVMEVGFLSDDFYFVARFARIAEASPRIAGQLWRGLTWFGAWNENFQAFRPLTIATLQVDYALHGLDARGFRASNILLWMLGAWLFSAVCAAYVGISSLWGRAATFLLCAWWPLAIEPYGWTVIRQDSLLVASSLAGALILRRRRSRPWLVTVPLVLAFASKETAILLPCVFAAVDGALLRREGVPPRRMATALLRRSWPWFVAAAAWAVLRGQLGAGFVWAGKSYAETVFSADTPTKLVLGTVNAIRALVLPVNLERAGRTVPLLLGGMAGLITIGALLSALRGARRAEVAACAAWFLCPWVLILPMYAVGPGLDSARSIVLPGIAFLFAVAAGASRLARKRRGLVLVASVVLLAAHAVVLRFNLGAFVDTSARVERLRSDVGPWPAGPAFVLRAHVGGVFDAPLMVHEGVFVFTAIHEALAPPFVPSKVQLAFLAEADERSLSALVADEARRGVIASLVYESGEPRFRLLCDRAFGAPMTLDPVHGSIVPRGVPPTFVVGLVAGDVAVGDVLSVVVADPSGNLIETRRTVSAEDVPLGTARIEFSARDFGFPEGAAPLRAVDATIFLWSATLLRGGVPVARSAYTVVNIEGDA